MYLRILTATALGLALSATANTNANANENAAKWAPTFELEGRTNADRSLIAPKFFIPLAQDDNSMLFTDIRSRFDDNSSEEYNLGVGYRKMHNGWIYGGYGFIDFLSSANDKSYWQATAGLEMLSEKWDFRVNGYLPESTRHLIAGNAGGSSVTIDGGGNFSVTTAGGVFERALPGVDAEVGYKLPLEAIDLRVFGGAYYFGADDFKSVSGPKARLELTFNEDNTKFLSNGMEFTLGVQYQNDGPREDTTTALAQFRIPFWAGEDRNRLTKLEKRMTNFIERDIDIVSGSAGSAGTTEAAQVNMNGNNYINGQIIDANTVNPDVVITTAGAGSFVALDGSAGNIITPNTFELAANQVLVGTGTELSVTGMSSGLNFTAIFLGTRPTLVSSNNTAISIDGSNFAGVYGIDLVASGGSTTGVYVNNSNDVRIIDYTYASASPNSGIGIDVANSDNLIINKINVDNSFYGIAMNGSADAQLNNATITNSSATGIALNNSANFVADNVILENSGSYGAYVDTSAGFKISNSAIRTAGSAGIYLDNSDNSTIEKTTIDGSSAMGVDINSSANVAFDQVTITNSGLNAIRLDGSSVSGNASASGSGVSDCLSNASTGSITVNGSTTCP